MMLSLIIPTSLSLFLHVMMAIQQLLSGSASDVPESAFTDRKSF